MIPVQLDVATVTSVEEAVDYLASHPDSRLLAGGTDIIPALSRRVLSARALVDLQHVPGLAALSPLEGHALRIGALATLAAIGELPDLVTTYPALAEAIASVADPQVRNRATVGGSIAQSRADGDVAAALLALDATLQISGPNGARSVPADAFFAAPSAARLRADEIVTAVDLPAGAKGSAYEKQRDPASGFAICGVAAVLQLGRDSTVSTCRLAVTGATVSVARLQALEAVLTGQPAAALSPFGNETLAAQRAVLSFSSAPPASADYRAHLMGVLAARAIKRAATRAVSGSLPAS